jgi:hypothetical protein
MKVGSLQVSLANHSNFLSPFDVLPFSNENLFKSPVKNPVLPPTDVVGPHGGSSKEKAILTWGLCGGPTTSVGGPTTSVGGPTTYVGPKKSMAKSLRKNNLAN